MIIYDFVDKANYIEYSEIENKKVEELVKYIYENKINRLYITKDLYPVYVIDNEKIVEIFIRNYLNLTFCEYIEVVKNCDVIALNYDRHIIETFNYMRKNRLMYVPVVKDKKIVGEVDFNVLSLKISFIAIKDSLTNLFNEKYFNVLIEEYNEVNEEIGIILIKVYNLAILESIYGYDFKTKVLKKVASILENSVRDIDFVFRNDDLFRIITFNNAEITMKIRNRIENRLKSVEVDGIEISTKVVATQIPEIDDNVLLGLERIEKELIKRD